MNKKNRPDTSDKTKAAALPGGEGRALGLGTLYGVGVGPGDPDLLTLRAHRILGSIGAVIAPKSKSEGESIALKVSRTSISHVADIHELRFPMTRDERLLDRFWREAAEIAVDYLSRRIDVAFVTLGDPTIYSTFSYLARAVHELEADVPIAFVPGITSFAAAAAKVGRSIAEADQPLSIVPAEAINGGMAEPWFSKDANLVLLKAGGRLNEILEMLEKDDRLSEAVVVSRLGLPGETIIGGLQGRHPSELKGVRDYLTLVLAPAKRKTPGVDSGKEGAHGK